VDAPLRTIKTRKPRPGVKVNLLIRRVHLYSGLFLIPWVMLYGVTGFLFNHPDAFSPSKKEVFALPESASVWADTNALADKVIAATGMGDAITRNGDASYSRSIFFRFSGESTGSLIMDLEKGKATARSRPAADESEPGPLDMSIEDQDLTFDDNALREMASGLFADSETIPEKIQIRARPNLIFDLDYEGKAWRASFDMRSGELAVKPEEEVSGPHWRTFLLRLHMTHVYRDDAARFAWALIVDIMALAMVTWAGTGIYMWWRMKKLRTIGWAMIAASIGVAALMGFGMYLTMMG
jgi:hypothetical protein